ncbi:DBH, partial [Cordylochernes scorpioides]
MIADEVSVNKFTVHQIITQDLMMRKVCAKWVPRVLTAKQKQRRVDVCREMLNELENKPDFLDNVVTGDESWTFQYDPETKAQSSEWHTPASPRPKKARMSKSRVKTMLIVFFDKRGLIHKEFVPQGKTVNAEFYKEVLRRLHKAVKRKRQDLAQRWRLHHDNAPAHTAFLVTSYLTRIGVEVLPQPPYSPDMSPPNFFLFPKPFPYPEEAGLPIGGPDFSRYVMLEVHYNNPDHRAGLVDSSGLRIYHTPRLRQHDAGVMELGLEYTDKMAIPPRQPAFFLSGHCVPECTRVGLPADGIVVFGSQLHTHLTGTGVWTHHYRGGQELPLLNGDDHYSTHFQEIRTLRNRVLVKPGDGLVTICRYATPDRSNITLGGFAISEEMCVNYVHYFPKTDLEVCKSSVDSKFLESYFLYEKEYNDEPTSPQHGISDNYHSIRWSRNNVEFLQRFYEAAPLSMQCNKSSGERFPHWQLSDWLTNNDRSGKIYSGIYRDEELIPRVEERSYVVDSKQAAVSR